jgi:hypothetical protein
LYASPNIIRVIKSRRIRGAEHVVRKGDTRNKYKILVSWSENLKGKVHLEDAVIDRKIILEWMLVK